jgi:hypothetical protein
VSNIECVLLCHSACFQLSSEVSFIKGFLQKEKQSRKGIVEYLGDFAEDTDACEDACRKHKDCAAFTHKTGKDGGPCYGILKDVPLTPANTKNEKTVSGLVTACKGIHI